PGHQLAMQDRGRPVPGLAELREYAACPGRLQAAPRGAESARAERQAVDPRPHRSARVALAPAGGAPPPGAAGGGRGAARRWAEIGWRSDRGVRGGGVTKTTAATSNSRLIAPVVTSACMATCSPVLDALFELRIARNWKIGADRTSRPATI